MNDMVDEVKLMKGYKHLRKNIIFLGNLIDFIINSIFDRGKASKGFAHLTQNETPQKTDFKTSRF